jgi:LAO/AO transport system kinase
MLARAITLIESSKSAHRLAAQELLQLILPETGGAHRIGMTGVPGVGKSTTIDQLGLNLVEAGHKVAVLAVDPSSTRTGGSILGDKTRMARLSQQHHAFIRPSPTSGTLGGVAAKTRETMELCEAAGFDIIIVETVGVGQSETTVAEMVDIFVVMLLAGAGDDLQGIKKGVIEIADLIAINKADGDNIPRATRAAAEYTSALHILTPADALWTPPVLTISGIGNAGLDHLWAKILDHKACMIATGRFAERRRDQAVGWMRTMLHERLMSSMTSNPAVTARLPMLEAAVRAGTLTPASAVAEIVELMGLAG